MASREATLENVRSILSDHSHPMFMAALKWATEQGYGKPKESIEHSGTITHAAQCWRFGDKEVVF